MADVEAEHSQSTHEVAVATERAKATGSVPAATDTADDDGQAADTTVDSGPHQIMPDGR